MPGQAKSAAVLLGVLWCGFGLVHAQAPKPPVDTFLLLRDTPDSYSGQAGKAVIVNPGATGLIFGTAVGGSTVSITGTAPIVVTPSPLTGTGVISINTSGFEVPITFSLSLVRATNTVTLVNDSASPGASKYYGTDGTSAKGWFALPAAGGVTSFNTRTGAVVPATNDYNFNQLAGVAATTQGGAPTAGLAGQVLKKNTNSNYDYSWGTDSTGGGGVNSFGTIAVSGQTNVDADSAPDTLTLAAGSNITLTTNASTDTVTIAAAGGGGGTVTDFSAGDLSPLFTTTEATTTTTPALSFALTAAPADSVFANDTTSSAAPKFTGGPRFARIANLTTDGFVKTSGGNGTLSVDTSTYLTSASISDTAYASSWDGVTTIAPSKNAIRDWGFIFDPDYDGKVEVLDLGAGLVKTSAGGVVSTAVAGTDYLTGNQAITLTGDVTGGPSATSIATTYNNVVPTGKGGVPTAGANGYVLQKLSALNYDYGWMPAGSGTVTTTGSPASGNMAKFSGTTSITNAVAGTDYQVGDADLTAIAAITGVKGDVLYYDGTTWAKLGGGTDGFQLTTHSTTGNPAWETAGGGVTLGGAPMVYVQTANLTPTGTTTTASQVMCGMGSSATLTPQGTGKVLVTFSGYLSNNSAGGGTMVQIRYGTGTAPANGAAASGTIASNLAWRTGTGWAISEAVPFSLSGIISGLTPGTAVWFDLTQQASTGGTTLVACQASAWEMPSGTVDNTAFSGATWNGLTDRAPTQNSVYDQLHLFDTDDDGKINVLDTVAGLVKTDASGVVSNAVAGTDYQAAGAYLTANQPITLTGDVTGGPAATSIATSIANNSVTLGDMATMATDSILGRTTASTGNVEVLAALPWADTGDVTRVADGKVTVLAAGNAGNLNSGTLLAARMPALTGEVTSTVNTVATTIADGITVANWTLTTPTIAAISNLTTNGFIKTGGAIGTLSVDTATYQASDADLTTWAGITPGTNVGTFLATPSSANLRAALTDENGTGAALFNAATTPDFTTGITIGGAAASRKMLVGDGTKFAASTETWAVPGTSGNVLTSDGTNWTSAAPAGGGAPTGADYLVGTANGSLSAEIVVGTSPGGELGGTWASPTIDDSITVASWTLTTPTIAAISNLTGNGFVKTSGGIGTLSVDTSTYLTSSSIDDTAYAGTWDTVTTIAPSKNAVYDKIETLQPLDTDLTSLAGISGVRGDVLFYGASGWARLGVGTSGNQLTTNGAGADPTWAAAGGGGGSATFIGLTDVPSSYSGSGGKVVAVNSGATALEFVSAPAAGAGGSNTQVQYNNSGSLAGDATLTFDNSTKFVTISTADVNGTAFRVTNTSVGGKVWQFTSIGSGGAAPGNFSFYNGTNTVLSMNSTQIATYAPAMFGWWSDASHATLGSFDTALGRNAAGVVEINNGTAGQYRDLKLRYLYFDNGAWVHATGNRIVLRGNGTTEDLSIDSAGLGLRSGQPINWSNSTTDSRTTWDVGIARNAAGVVEVNNGSAGTYRDIKVDEVDAVTGYKIGGAAASGKILIGNGTDYVASTPTYPTAAGTAGYEVMSNGTNFVSYPTSIFNSSTTSQSPSTSEVYVAGSSVVVTAGDFKAKGQYRCIFDVTKTAGTGGIVVAVKVGTAGTTGDTTRVSFPAFGAGTSVADHAVFEVVVTWRTVGTGTSAVLAGFVRGTHQLATTGMFGGANVWQPAYTASSGFNSSADTTMGITFTGGTAFSGTIDTVQATLNQP